jgi:SAM-dependent methyltransferase
LIYEALNHAVLPRVPKTTRRLLDLGCGSGALGRKIKEETNCHVTGITFSKAEAALAGAHLDEVVVCDLNTFASNEAGSFDCVICSHVLEHLNQPDDLLRRLQRELTPHGTLIVALPNVLNWRQRVEFMRGNFRYTDGGPMDRTHYRFFDWNTAQELLTQSGYCIVAAEADGSFPLSRFLFGIGDMLDRAALRLSPGLFGFQFIFVCRPRSN